MCNLFKDFVGFVLIFSLVNCFSFLDKNIIHTNNLKHYVNLGSEKAKAEIECQLDRIYGDTEKQKLDIFGADTLPGGELIFIIIK